MIPYPFAFRNPKSFCEDINLIANEYSKQLQERANQLEAEAELTQVQHEELAFRLQINPDEISKNLVTLDREYENLKQRLQTIINAEVKVAENKVTRARTLEAYHQAKKDLQLTRQIYSQRNKMTLYQWTPFLEAREAHQKFIKEWKNGLSEFRQTLQADLELIQDESTGEDNKMEDTLFSFSIAYEGKIFALQVESSQTVEHVIQLVCTEGKIQRDESELALFGRHGRLANHLPLSVFHPQHIQQLKLVALRPRQEGELVSSMQG